MSTFADIDPTQFISQTKQTPVHGRGAWSRAGIGDSTTYHGREGVKVGDEAERGLDYWSVSAGVYAIQERLQALGKLTDLPPEKSGVYAKRTRLAVKAFQLENGIKATGEVGSLTARALWLPVLDKQETDHQIPDHWLRGIISQESAWDPGAVGWFIFYDQPSVGAGGPTLRYGGVDRGLAQINSKANSQVSWIDAFRPWKSLAWAAERLRDSFDELHRIYPNRDVALVWQAAVVNHNSPVNARAWLDTGVANDQARAYVDAVAKARGIG